VGLLNPGGPIAQFKRNRCSISPVEVILLSGVRNADHGEIPPLSFAFFLLYVMMLLLASPFRRKKRPCCTVGFLEHSVLSHMRTYVYCFGQKKYYEIVGNDGYT